jgi:hypothetical protein
MAFCLMAFFVRSTFSSRFVRDSGYFALSSPPNNSNAIGTVTGPEGCRKSMGSIFAVMEIIARSCWLVSLRRMLGAFFVCRHEIAARGVSCALRFQCLRLVTAIGMRGTPEQDLFESSNVG